jgi:hypothetical protein
VAINAFSEGQMQSKTNLEQRTRAVKRKSGFISFMSI